MADLLEFRNLKIEATSYPPGEPPRHVVLVDDVSVTVAKGRVLGGQNPFEQMRARPKGHAKD